MQILDQEICQNGLISKEYDFSDGKVFRMEQRVIQIERDSCCYLSTATMDGVENFLGREKSRITIDISFGSRFTSDAWNKRQKHQVLSVSPGLFFALFGVLKERGQGFQNYPWSKKHFRLCIELVRKDVFRSYAQYGFGFNDVIETSRIVRPFGTDEFRAVLLERFKYENFHEA